MYILKKIDVSKFYVISVISNPIRYRSRYRLYQAFEKQVLDAGANLVTIEQAFARRPHEITTTDPEINHLYQHSPNRIHIQMRSNIHLFQEIWLKENLINCAIARLPQDWKYVAWADADISFVRPDWVQETVQQLQHFKIVQMWDTAEDLSPDYRPIQSHRGFVYCWDQGLPFNPEILNQYTGAKKNTVFWHPGFSWAARRDAIENLGGLYEESILGAGDHIMSLALINSALKRAIPKTLHSNYYRGIKIWQDRANQYIKQNIGYVSGLITHGFHGKKRDRKYWDRWKILEKNNFDPELDLKKDSQGQLQLTDRNPQLRIDIQRYFRQRNEDSIDLE